MTEERQKRIFLSPPHMCGEEIHFVKAAFDSNYIAPLGPMVDAFEKEFCERKGILNAVAVSSGMAAMRFQPVSQVEKHKAQGSRREVDNSKD
jgi:dTDP-4-amino-4,6-dideoxygalactose transaminase